MRKGAVPPQRTSTPPPGDVQLAVDLFRLVCSNLPMRTEVDAIPRQFSHMYRGMGLPIPPEALGNVLQGEFGHLFAFTWNRMGQVLCEPKLPPDTPLDEVARVHVNFRTGNLPAPGPIAKQGQVAHPLMAVVRNQNAVPASRPVSATTPAVRKLAPEEESSIQWLLKGLYQALVRNPSIGRAQSIVQLRTQLECAYFDLFGLPMTLVSGLVVDPIELLRKNEGKCFTKFTEEPVHGEVSIGPIIENPQFVPQISLSVSPSSGPVPVPPRSEKDTILAGMNALRAQTLLNLQLIDSALAKGEKLVVLDAELWKTGIDRLLQQEAEGNVLLKHLCNA